MQDATQYVWVPLAKLADKFAANLEALGQCQPDLADELSRLRGQGEYFIAARADRLVFAHQKVGASAMELLGNPVAAARAREIAAKVYPQGDYNQPLLIAGLDQGWLWDAVYKLRTANPAAPGMRLPIYLLAGELERLWAVLHYQSWTDLLRDPRVHITAGPQAAAHLEQWLLDHPRLAMPKLAITVDPGVWSSGQNLEAMSARISTLVTAKVAELHRRMDRPGPVTLPADRPLRVMGITSRYTTFLQHSMRDWLAAMVKLGHQTRLVIEAADHELLPALAYAQECAEFRPDLILIIDHYRAEMPGLPKGVPCVMWVQDRLPNIYRAEAGKTQGDGDYVIGYGRQECTQKWSYPSGRFMPAMVGANEDRFAPRELSAAELDRYGCDVSFVSHASMPAEEIVEQEAIRANNPLARRLLEGILKRLRSIYDSGSSVTGPAALETVIQSALNDLDLKAEMGPLLDLVSQRLNNALIRHQAIRWAAQTGVDLRLYGRGWEKHPEFSSFARGVAENQNELAIIYQASRINLQVTPFGPAHQRLFEGLAAGGFFLMRSVTGDAAELAKLQLWQWCRTKGVSDGLGMLQRGLGDPAFQKLSSQLALLTGVDLLADPQWFYAGMEEAALGGFSRSATTLWPEYQAVSFWTQQELTHQIQHYLKSADERRAITASMRREVLRWHTYGAISRRMLAWIHHDLAQEQPLRAAA